MLSWTQIYPAFANSVDPDQLVSGSALFAFQDVNLYQQSGSSNLIGLQLEMGMASWLIQHEKGLGVVFDDNSGITLSNSP